MNTNDEELANCTQMFVPTKVFLFSWFPCGGYNKQSNTLYIHIAKQNIYVVDWYPWSRFYQITSARSEHQLSVLRSIRSIHSFVA